MKRSYEELETDLRSTQGELSLAREELVLVRKELALAGEESLKLKGLLKSALERIVKLEAKINRNSKNSSKPPSTDQKGDTPENSEKKTRKSRPGRARTPYPPERVDRHVDCVLDKCPHCNSYNIREIHGSLFSWQQVDLPSVQAIVTQFNCHRYWCRSCWQNSLGSPPPGIPSSAFGPKLMALIVELTGRFHMAKRDAMLLVRDLYGVEISEGSIVNLEERASMALDPIYERIHHFVIQKAVARYLDETTWRNDGKRRYIWLATSTLAAYYRIDPCRSQEAFFKVVGTHLNVPSVTDRYGVYRALDGPHQYCLAHLIRDFHSFVEEGGDSGQVALKLEQELRKACGIHGSWRTGKISSRQRKLRLSHSRRRLDGLFGDAMAVGSDKLAGLCMHLEDEFEHLWTFVSTEGVEPTNNMAERDLRKLVLWRKKSYGTRSARGQRFVERITSVVETIKKNGANVLGYLEGAIRAFIQRQSPPFINEAMGF